MLVEINLLPKKENRNTFVVVLLIASLAAVIVLGTLFWFVNSQKTQERDQLKNQLADIQRVRGTLEQQKVSQENGSSVDKLTKAIQWSEDYPFPVSKVLKDLTCLLPERGYMLSFHLLEDGSIECTFQFDSSRESAFYLQRLKASKIISKAEITRIDTRDIVDRGTSDNPSIPRYISQYVLSINKDAFAKAHEEEDPS